MAQYPARFGHHGHHLQAGGRSPSDEDLDEEDEDDLSSSAVSQANADRVTRNFIHQQQQQHHHHHHRQATSSKQTETIQVKLNEGYFASERRQLVELLANCRQRISSLHMFNPAKNQSARAQQEQQWSEKEKYTLDSLNEIKGGLDEQFQWTRAEDEREVWGSKLQYFLAITSYSIGLGNVIRFPILVQKNGGLAFIIPFVIMLIVEGIPLFYLELAVGQRMRKAAVSCWNLVSPFAAGIGLASAAVSFVIGLYYNTMVAWTLLYLWGSASTVVGTMKQQQQHHQPPLPFSVCPAAANGSAGAVAAAANSTEHCQTTGPFQHYWFRRTLDASEDVDQWNHFNWPVLAALTAAWLISYFCLAKGLSGSKRVVYVTFTFPYVILTIFFFKAISLKGMSEGVYYLFEPEWSKLADPYVWLQSAAQVFFSLGLGFGGLIALSSYNPVNNNCYKDAVKVSLINFFTSIYAGIVIFAILGFKAQLSYDKCLVQREQAITYYLSDYYLKVLDYGAVFNQVVKDKEERGEDVSRMLAANNLSIAGSAETSTEDYFDTSDALESIRSIDKQLANLSASSSSLSSSSSSSSSLVSSNDYVSSDGDSEFIIDLGGMINDSEYEKIIADIPGLPHCSVRQELEDSTQGTGLVFVTMAEAISQFDNAPIWATSFFFMLLMFGLDSQFGNLEGLLSSLADLNFANSLKRQWLTGFICCLSLIISVCLFAHGAGSYMFAIFDEYAGSFSLVLIALFELIAISYIYGLKKFCDDCELMTGRRPPFIILLSWRYISPILLLIVIAATIREFTVSLTYEAWIGDHLVTKSWPSWCILLGSLLIISCILWIPAIAILRILKINVIPEESLNQCWFPAEELREFYDIQEEHKVTKTERVLFGFRSDDD